MKNMFYFLAGVVVLFAGLHTVNELKSIELKRNAALECVAELISQEVDRIDIFTDYTRGTCKQIPNGYYL